MDYGQIIKRSWVILKTNKFLWGLGFVAALASGGGGMNFNFPYMGGGSGSGSSPAQFQPTASPRFSNPNLSMAGTGRVLGEAVKRGESLASKPISSGSVILIIGGIIVSLSVAILLLYFSVSAGAGLIVAVDKIENKGEKMTFRTAIGAGRKFFWRVFSVGLLFLAWTLMIFIVAGLFIALAVLLKSVTTTVLVVAICVLLFLLFLVSSFYFGILSMFISRIIVLENLGPIVSIEKAHQMIKNNWREALISWLILLAIGIGLGLATALVMMLLLGVLGLVGFGVYASIGIGFTILYGIVMGAIFIIALLIVRGFVTAYTSIYTTLVYRALRCIDTQKAIAQ